MPATRPFLPHVLLVFDFDGTLGHDSTDALLAHYGMTRDEWERDYEEPLGKDWDEIVRRGQALIDLGRARGRPLTRDVLDETGRGLKLFPGVLEMPDRLRAVAREIHPKIELRFVVLSSGYAEIIGAIPIAKAFDRVLASAFHFGSDGQAVCVKRVVSHPEKVLYLQALAKDLDIGGANAPQAAGRDVPEADRVVPYDQMIYVGDGASDLQAFGLLNEEGGIALAIDKDGQFDHTEEQQPGQRVDNLAPPDYAEDGQLLQSLAHAVRACASRIALRALARGE